PEAYLLHRGAQIISETTGFSYDDMNISAGQTYIYSVQARYPGGLLSPHSNSFSITVPVDGSEIILFESFEQCPSFTQQIPRFQNLDLDGSLTWSWENLDFPSEGNALGWLVFAPAQTTPPLTDISVPTGAKLLLSASAMTPPNNDWLIFPNLHLGNSASLEFTARSLTAAYGLERLRVLISTTNSAPGSFSLLHAGDWLSIPAGWTDYEFDLGAYANQDVYLAINAVSLDAFALFVDDIKVHGIGGHVDVQNQAPAAFRPYPNPAQGDFSLKSQAYFDLKIYNLKGQRIASYEGIKDFNSSQLSLIPGIYILRLKQDGQQHTYRQIVLP
ncbi:MAG: choice-of-anchor J domain-containing protein, partial [Desulfuromonadaceae bacterium]|nr:choice-of-anchor J domain-containing protein [Desulfuromonadaceae bacterium]